MASSLVVKIIYFLILISLKSSNAQLTPALFVFGDSLIDVGNNNYLAHSPIKANHPHNGIDFPTHKPTGRFSNGKVAADFLAEKLGLPSSPPYLQLTRRKRSDFSAGVSFASGGAGIFDETNKNFCLSMNKQVQLYGEMKGKLVQQLGAQRAQRLLSQSLCMVVMGNNDIFAYDGFSISSQTNKVTPQQYANAMVHDFKGQLKRIYDLGARKFIIFGIGEAGCCPGERDKNKTTGYACREDGNLIASHFNKGLVSFLKDYQTQLKEFQYTYLDTYGIFTNLIQQHDKYGFKEAKAACCGKGILNAEDHCIPTATYCSNRNDHVWWDAYHPSEAVNRIIIETGFNGPPTYSFPVNVKQLVLT